MLHIKSKFLQSGIHDKVERVAPGHAAALGGVWVVQPRVARADAQGGGVAVEHDGAQAVHRQPRQRPATALLLLLLCEVVQQVRALGVQT